MDRNSWKVNRISDIIGLSRSSVHYLHPAVLVTIKERLSAVNTIGAAILYGSIARGDASTKSDIDILIIPSGTGDMSSIEKDLQDTLHDIESEFRLPLGFSYSIYTGNEDPYFLWEILKDGIVIFCRAEAVIPSVSNIKPYALVSYSFTGLDETMKKRTHRFLFESRNGARINRSNKMEYIAPGVIILPLSRIESIIDHFGESHIHYSMMKIWR